MPSFAHVNAALMVLVMTLVVPFTSLAAPAAPPVSAAAWVVIDASQRQVLAAREPHARLAVASLTKIMTAVVALRYGALTDEFVVDARDRPGEASIGLQVGERVTLETLLYGLLMRSGNDAGAVIARGVGTSVALSRGLPLDGPATFIDLMNDQAAALGMVNTQFRNPHGLDAPDHVSSAYDLALLTEHALRDPTFRRAFGATSYLYRGGIWSNSNRLLTQYDGLIGGKTGVETEAGLCLVEVAQRGDRRIVVVVLNAPRWYDDARALLDFGFAQPAAPSPTTNAFFGLPAPLTGRPWPRPAALPGPLGRTDVDRGVGQAAPHAAVPDAASSSSTAHPTSVDGAIDQALTSAPERPDLVPTALVGAGLLALAATIALGVQARSAARRAAPPADQRSLRALPLPLAHADGPPPRGALVSRPTVAAAPAIVHRSMQPGDDPMVTATPAHRPSPTPRPVVANDAGEHADEPIYVALAVPPAGAAAQRSVGEPAASASGALLDEHVLLAIRHARAGRASTAESFFVKAIQIAPDARLSALPVFWSMPPEAFMALILAYGRCQRPSQARAVAALAVVAHPSDAELQGVQRRLQAEARG